MLFKRATKASFSVIGKEGSTLDGEGFIDQLWETANSHFGEVEALAKKDEQGKLVGVWGAMSDFSKEFKPWEDGFTKGLYLASVEVVDGAEPPKGWTKWVIPAYDYVYAKVEGDVMTSFKAGLDYLAAHDLKLAGAVHDFLDPKEGCYLFFPIKKLEG